MPKRTMNATRRAEALLATLLSLSVLVGCETGKDIPSTVNPYGDETIDGKADSTIAVPSDCAFDPADPFEPRARLPKGPFAGQCIDTRQRRSAIRLSDEAAADFGGPAEDSLVVANVFHDSAFWVARIPLRGIESVIFQLEYFPAVVPAGHTQARVRFLEGNPVVLMGQTPRDRGKEVRIHDLVLSVEAVGQVGYSYDLFRGMNDNFGAVYRVTSLDAKILHMCINQDHLVEQWPLQMSADEMKNLVWNYIQESASRQMNVMYHTLYLNCTNEIVRIVDTAMDYSWREQVQRFLAKATEFYPNVVRAALAARALVPLNKSTDLLSLSTDPTVSDIFARLRGL